MACLGILVIGSWGCLSPAVQASSTRGIVVAALSPEIGDPGGREEVTQRLASIATQMELVRLCNRPGCRYKDIHFQVLDPDQSSGGTIEYRGVIDAVIDRPADTIDKAHYRFEFRQGRWHLMGGEEISDVSSFVFEEDTYEVFSSYSGRSRLDKLANASPKLRVGYRALYQRVMDQGEERWPLED
ncbi:MAG: hypothetical protein HC924_10030 [Synechococcaceae cyanobacterium SM2_3_2]|nr:hypothetical protein [Synechococcaceae cyanobacterium SM2_3_2]